MAERSFELLGNSCAIYLSLSRAYVIISVGTSQDVRGILDDLVTASHLHMI